MQGVRPGHLFEGGLEGVHQLVRQLVDEAHRVAHDDRLAFGEPHPAGGRVKGGEEHVLGVRGFLAHQAR